jgi:hypothetical protein
MCKYIDYAKWPVRKKHNLAFKFFLFTTFSIYFGADNAAFIQQSRPTKTAEEINRIKQEGLDM